MTKQEVLEQKQIEFVLKSEEYKEMLNEVCFNIVNYCKTATNESSVVSVFERELYGFIEKTLKIKRNPEKEKPVNTVRHELKGKIDSQIGTLIIEFKQPSSFSTLIQKKAATQQLIEYMNGLYKENGLDYMGFVTDGVECQVLDMEAGHVTHGSYEKLSFYHLDLLVKNIILLGKTALTPENLVKSFCDVNEYNLSHQLTLELYKTLKLKSTGKTKMLFREWKELFRLAHDDKSKQKAIEERKKALADVIGEDFQEQNDEYLSLYALQTTYAIIVKIIAYKVISKVKFNHSLIDFNVLASADSNALRHQMYELEEGAVFRDIGIGNLLEGDFFAWYSAKEQWNDNIGILVQKIFKLLTPYEDKSIFNKVEKVSDLFKDLYMHIIPDKVRHSLGEFYTPPWLADNLIDSALKQINNKEWKGLDPCSGSGTFITVLIRKVLEETNNQTQKERLNAVLSRVKGIDLNPLAVLTARINYFINISPLISEEDEFEIPVYLGDSSYVPKKHIVDDVECLVYQIQTVKGGIKIQLPKSVVANADVFSKVMTSIEVDIHNLDEEEIVAKLLNLVPKQEQKQQIIDNTKSLANQFVELEKQDWNGIWARIVTNFLTTANLGFFDVIVGNPPWIDWKNLPTGYRTRVKDLCIDRKIFSGDGVTGGINLNICALISNVSAQNWLGQGGVLAFLMPQSLLFQQSYEGFRNFQLDDNQHLYLQEVYDWTKSGHPFKPVQHKFLSFFYSDNLVDYKKGVPVLQYIKKNGSTNSIEKYKNTVEFSKISKLYKQSKCWIGQVNKKTTAFSYADTKKELKNFQKISGSTKYKAREGIEFYPQELFILEPDYNMPQLKDRIYVKNFQNKKSKYKIPQQTIPLETKFLHPLIRGVDIQRFHIMKSNYLVPFPYKEDNVRSPLNIKELTKSSNLLAKYFNKLKSILIAQTDYNAKIIGEKHNNEFYALARVGAYSFAKNYVVFRDNTKWQAVVVTEVDTPWGEKKRPQFQNHAVSISQDGKGRFITLEEAHYICAIFNTPLTTKYILNSSDSRTFKIQPPLKIPEYSVNNRIHRRLMWLSKLAHRYYDNKDKMNNIDEKLNKFILKLK